MEYLPTFGWFLGVNVGIHIPAPWVAYGMWKTGEKLAPRKLRSLRRPLCASALVAIFVTCTERFCGSGDDGRELMEAPIKKLGYSWVING
jgi:hypothetical protein